MTHLSTSNQAIIYLIFWLSWRFFFFLNLFQQKHYIFLLNFYAFAKCNTVFMAFHCTEMSVCGASIWCRIGVILFLHLLSVEAYFWYSSTDFIFDEYVVDRKSVIDACTDVKYFLDFLKSLFDNFMCIWWGYDFRKVFIHLSYFNCAVTVSESLSWN